MTALPDILRKDGLFCCWRYEERNGRKTKVPYQPDTGLGAKSNDPSSFVSYDSVYIKNLIMRHLHGVNGITDGTKEYIFSKCKHDANFVVRMVCAEVEEKRIDEE